MVVLYLTGSLADTGHTETRVGGAIEGAGEQQVQCNL